MKARFFIVLILLGSALNVQAQLKLNPFKKHTRVKLSPTNKSYKLEDEEVALEEGFFDERERWVVFSDRASNKTYKSAGSEVELKSVGFMEPCYVIGRSGDYLELVRWDARLVKETKTGFIDRKGADYLGWMPRKRLLLWRSALKENNSKFYIKAITCLKNEAAFAALPHFAQEDSLLLYDGPALKTVHGKCGMENLFYLFRQSDDGKQYLLSRAPQITPENYKEVVAGWISKDFVKVWGTRSAFMLNNVPKVRDEKSLPPSIPFYADTAIAPFFTATPALTGPVLLENIFPAQQFTDLQDSTVLIKTGVLTDVLDRSENEVMNVLGKPIRYDAFKKIVAAQGKTNIVFVVDGGRENGKYLPNLLTVIQKLELYFDTSRQYRQMRYGAVVYKDNLGGSCKTPTLPLTQDYSSVLRFFEMQQQQINSCNDDTVAQAMFPGVLAATRLLKEAKDETNIIILVGAAGNNMDASGYNEVISGLSYVNARMLVFQTHSQPNPSYNDFVIQSKNLVLKTAVNESELKKLKLVDLADVLNNPSFSLTTGDSGVYYLDYPHSSMTQGYVLFPEKGQAMQPVFLEHALDSLMRQAGEDNLRIKNALYRYFNTIGIRNTKLLASYRGFYPMYDTGYLPIDFLKSYRFADGPFYVPANIRYSMPQEDHASSVKFGLLLSADEYDVVMKIFFDLAGNRDFSKEKRKVLYRHLHQVVATYLHAKNIAADERVSKLSLAECLEWLTGYHSADPAWNELELHTITHKKNNAGKAAAQRLISRCAASGNWMQDNMNNGSIRFSNNGQVYYWLPAEYLP